MWVCGWINYDSWNNYDRGKAAAENTVDNRGWFDLILSCQSTHLFARLQENAVFKESSVFCSLSSPPHPPKKKKEKHSKKSHSLLVTLPKSNGWSRDPYWFWFSFRAPMYFSWAKDILILKLQIGRVLTPASGWNSFQLALEFVTCKKDYSTISASRNGFNTRLVHCSAVTILKFVIIFSRRALRFHFALGSASHWAGPSLAVGPCCVLHLWIRPTSRAGLHTCSVKVQILNLWGSVVSVAAPQRCHAGTEAALGSRRRRSTAVFSDTLYTSRQGVVGLWSWGRRLRPLM